MYVNVRHWVCFTVNSSWTHRKSVAFSHAVVLYIITFNIDTTTIPTGFTLQLELDDYNWNDSIILDGIDTPGLFADV